MLSNARSGLLASVSFAILATAAAAQVPKAGDYYEDAHDVGFKVKVPKGWEFIPAPPDDGNLLGKYEPDGSKYITLKGDEVLFITCWLVEFDRRPKPEADEAPPGSIDEAIKRASVTVSPDIDEWIKRMRTDLGSGFTLVEKDETKVGDVEAVELLYEGKSPGSSAGPGGLPIYAYAMLYKVHPDVDVAMVFNAPADKKKWSKWESACKRMFKTFKAVEVGHREAVAEGGSARDHKRAELELQMATNPGWELYETPNYFVVSNSEDLEFVEEACDRLEAIRKEYEKDYPLEKALKAREAAQRREDAARAKRLEELKEQLGERWREALDEEQLDELENGDRSRSIAADPMEESRTSVVRICATRAQYTSYNGPPNSAGYWSWVDEELVLYDDKVAGRNETWDTLHHEAFHQYIYYFYGNISPHSWYNEGSGDYYGAHKYFRNRFEVQESKGRLGDIREAIRGNKHVPLEKLVRFTQGEYYGSNSFGADIGQNYAQGWSLVYFLRTGQKKAKGWDDSWNGILEKYLDALVETGDLDAAVDAAFAGVDWTAFEESWKAYIG